MKIVTFGEIMARLATPGFLRLRQALPGSLNVTFAGAEANVAASLAMLGARPEFVTALPRHAIAEACIDALRALGVATDHIVRSDAGRLGLYFLETGANQRASQVRSGLSRCGLQAEKLGTAQIIELFYHVYNPLSSQNQKIDNVSALDIPVAIPVPRNDTAE